MVTLSVTGTALSAVGRLDGSVGKLFDKLRLSLKKKRGVSYFLPPPASLRIIVLELYEQVAAYNIHPLASLLIRYSQ